jgi:hypothetical protein
VQAAGRLSQQQYVLQAVQLPGQYSQQAVMWWRQQAPIWLALQGGVLWGPPAAGPWSGRGNALLSVPLLLPLAM